MAIYKQIIFLSMLLIVVMVSCVYVHINDFEIETTTPNEKLENNFKEEDNITEPIASEEIIKKELLEEESLKTEENIEEEKIVEELIEKPEIIADEEESKELKESETIPSVLPSNKRIEELSKRIEPKSKEIDIQEELDLVFEKEKIVFKRLSTNITDESKVLVKKVAEILKKYKNVNIEIGGHTDAKGKADVNQWISLQRAISVKKELIKLEISKNRIKAKGYGETRPLVPNNENGYAIENRRVEIKVIEE